MPRAQFISARDTFYVRLSGNNAYLILLFGGNTFAKIFSFALSGTKKGACVFLSIMKHTLEFKIHFKTFFVDLNSALAKVKSSKVSRVSRHMF